MSLDLLLIGGLILVIFGIAVWSMRKNKKTELNLLGDHTTNNTNVDTTALAKKIAKANAAEMRKIMQEFLEELKKVQIVTTGSTKKQSLVDDFEITMDESVIPIDMNVEVQATNLENATTEKKVVDKDLSKSKSKLAGLFKKKK